MILAAETCAADAAAEVTHRQLAAFNQRRLQPAICSAAWRDDLAREWQMRHLEGNFVESERAAVSDLAAEAPTDAGEFLAWFEALRDDGPGQDDPLFPWLADQATREDMRFFLSQELAGEAGFDDLVALTQVKLPPRAKLELARNYWDEVGRGRHDGMHTYLLQEVARELDLPSTDQIVWEALALANLQIALAANRRYVYHAIGALGVVELTAPDRVALVNDGLRRLGLPMAKRQYYEVHATLDRKHSSSWNREVVRPLIDDDPAIARAIAEGALMRLTAGARCYARYRLELGLMTIVRARAAEQHPVG